MGLLAWIAALMSSGPVTDGLTDERFPYVYVNNDGSARELTAEEQEYLRTEFHPADGGRPYIKLRYGSRTPDGRLRGFLRRRSLPARVVVRPAADR